MTIYRPNTAIPTRYHGYYFRSRLEARWAVDFKTLGLDWRYEAEGLQSPSGERWLPDFLLNVQHKKVWVEIKPPGCDDGARLERMAEGMSEDEQIWAVAADIPDPVRLYQGVDCGHLQGSFNMIFGKGRNESVGWDNYHYLCVCPDCRAIGLEFEGRSARIECGCPKGDSDKNYTTAHPTMLQAYAAGRAVRFEHDDREVWSGGVVYPYNFSRGF